jgi:hypothetical protein
MIECASRECVEDASPAEANEAHPGDTMVRKIALVVIAALAFPAAALACSEHEQQAAEKTPTTVVAKAKKAGKAKKAPAPKNTPAKG